MQIDIGTHSKVKKVWLSQDKVWLKIMRISLDSRSSLLVGDSWNVHAYNVWVCVFFMNIFPCKLHTVKLLAFTHLVGSSVLLHTFEWTGKSENSCSTDFCCQVHCNTHGGQWWTTNLLGKRHQLHSFHWNGHTIWKQAHRHNLSMPSTMIHLS